MFDATILPSSRQPRIAASRRDRRAARASRTVPTKRRRRRSALSAVRQRPKRATGASAPRRVAPPFRPRAPRRHRSLRVGFGSTGPRAIGAIRLSRSVVSCLIGERDAIRPTQERFACGMPYGVARPCRHRRGALRRGRCAPNSTAWKTNRSRPRSRHRTSRRRPHRCPTRSAAHRVRSRRATATGNTKVAAPISRLLSRHPVRRPCAAAAPPAASPRTARGSAPPGRR